jgi:glycosyltransferase involved in cell wall biosynthesis
VASAVTYWRRQWFRSGYHPDVLHAHDFPSALAGVLLKRAFGIPLVVTVHRAPKYPDQQLAQWNEKECFLSLIHDSEMHAHWGNMKEGVALGPFVDRFVSPSQYCHRGLLDAGFQRDRAVVIPHGVPIDSLRGVNDLPEATRGLLAPPGARIVLCPSRIDEHKGLRDFIDAAAELNREFGDLYFVVAGGTPTEPTSKRLLSELLHRVAEAGLENIQFGHSGGDRRDFLPEEMPTLFRRAFVCVLPSHTENYPVALLEAQALGCPVVASGVGGVPELLAGGESGLLFERGKPSELCERLAALLQNSHLRDRIVAAAETRLRLYGDGLPMAREYGKLYLELTGIALK